MWVPATTNLLGGEPACPKVVITGGTPGGACGGVPCEKASAPKQRIHVAAIKNVFTDQALVLLNLVNINKTPQKSE